MNEQDNTPTTPLTPTQQIELPLAASSNLPFPELIVDRPSARIVGFLKDASFSKHSEMTGLSSYLYQSWITSPQNKALADALEKISMVEMRHLDALANAIVAFGGNPNYSNSNGAYWSGSYVDFCKEPKHFLRGNIEAERRAISDYRKLQSETTNQSLISLIDKIISDELVHIQIFESFLAQY